MKNALVYAVAAVICCFALSNGFEAGMKNIQLAQPSAAQESQLNGWTVAHEYNDGWAIFNKDTGQMCILQNGQYTGFSSKCSEKQK